MIRKTAIVLVGVFVCASAARAEWVAYTKPDGDAPTYFSNEVCHELGAKSFGFMVQWSDHGGEVRGCWAPDEVSWRVGYPTDEEGPTNRTWTPNQVHWNNDGYYGVKGTRLPAGVHVQAIPPKGSGANAPRRVQYAG